MHDARAEGPADDPFDRPIENSYVVGDSRLVAGEYPGSPPSNPTSDLEGRLARFLDAGVSAFIDLTSPDEGLAPYEPTLRALAERRGVAVEYERLAIPDMDVCDEQQMCRVLDAIDEHLRRERTVYVHCHGGVGRTGTVVGCWLVRHGETGPAALAEVARLFATMSPGKVRRHAVWGSPQTTKQRAMVEGWLEGVMTRRSSAKTREARRRRTERAAPAAATGRRRSERAGIARVTHTRIRGCLLGGALGDALGRPVEFLSLTSIRSRYGAAGIQDLVASANGVAEITDDTQLTLFTAEGVLRSTTRHMEYWAYSEPEGTDWGGEHMPHPDVMRYAYLRWLQTQQGESHDTPHPDETRLPGEPGWLVGVERLHARRSPGNTCLSGLQSREGGTVEHPLNDSKGCGGVMRVAPIGLVPCADPFGYAVMAAAITHGNPSGYLSAGAYAQMLSDLLFDPVGHGPRLSLRESVEGVLARLEIERGHEETSASLTRALELAGRAGEPSPERVEALGGGWTGEEALAIGVYCAIVAEDFEHGVRLAVNHSGDSDSTGSIAGALLGVQFGEYGLPAEWLPQLELRDVISAVADDLLLGYGGGAAWRERYPGS
jgi:ADP-ribosylglycohydrolase